MYTSAGEESFFRGGIEKILPRRHFFACKNLARNFFILGGIYVILMKIKGNQSFQRLTQRHEVKRLVKGYAGKCKSDIHKDSFITKKRCTKKQRLF